MRYRFELSAESERQLSRLPRDVQERLTRAIDDLESKDDKQWSNVKALQGTLYKGLLRKKVGAYRIIFQEFPSRAWRKLPPCP